MTRNAHGDVSEAEITGHALWRLLHAAYIDFRHEGSALHYHGHLLTDDGKGIELAVSVHG
jgi:hypothetical protein